MKYAFFLTIVLVFIFGIMFYFISFDRKTQSQEFSQGFNAVIKNVKRTQRKYHILTLSVGNNEFELTDNISRDKGHEYLIGDSIIKKANSCSYYHKRNSKVIFEFHNNCNQIYISSIN